MFGELIGLWRPPFGSRWARRENVRVNRARPRTRHSDVRRIAGRRAWSRIPRRQSSCIWSKSVRRCNRCNSGGWKVSACRHWHATFEDVPSGPTIIIANEFIDALPVHQAVKQSDGWHERVSRSRPKAISRSARRAMRCRLFENGNAARVAARAPKGAIYYALG